MAGYSGQLVALNAETPTEIQQGAALADQASTQSQLARATMPSDIAIKQEQARGFGIANDTSQLSLSQQQAMHAAMQEHLESIKAAQAAYKASQQGGGSPLASVAPTGAAGAPVASPLASALPPNSHLFDPQVEGVMQSVDPSDPNASDKFDARMRALSKDVPSAAQFIGQGSSDNLNKWRGLIGAHVASAASQPPASPLAGMAPPAQGGVPQPLANAGGPVAPISPLTGQPDFALAKMAAINPEAASKQISMEGMIKYQQTRDPQYLRLYAPELYKSLAESDKNLAEAQKAQLATKFSTMGQVSNAVLALINKPVDPTKPDGPKLGPNSPEVVSAYRAALTELVNDKFVTPEFAQQRFNQGLTTGNMAELGTFATEAQAAETYYKTSGQEAIDQARAKQAYPETNNQVIGFNNGRPVVINTRAPAGTPAYMPGGATVDTTRSGSTLYQTKIAALTQAGISPQAAALIASGQHVLEGPQAAIAAGHAAQLDKETAALTGQPFDQAAAYANYYREFSTAGGGIAGGAPAPVAGASTAAPGAPPAPPAAVAGSAVPPPTPAEMAAVRPNPRFPGITPAQQAIANRFHGQGASTPAVPTSKAQYDRLKPGTVYVRWDGWVGPKK